MLTTFLEQNRDLLVQTVRELCVIPSPSGKEQARADYCRRWLEQHAGIAATVDAMHNVYAELGCDGSEAVTVAVAHTDIVFDESVALTLTEDERVMRCPGIGDNTASAAVLLLAVKYIVESGQPPRGGLAAVWNVCEEGLGNLKGARAVCDRYAGRIARFVSLDCHLDEIATRCVGSHRYRVTAHTAGGHSYLAFGQRNAIAVLSGIVQEIYALAVPQDGQSHTTYNVGTVQGGTSVNTIAQDASMTCEVRSDNAAHLQHMNTLLRQCFYNAEQPGVEINVTRIGDRPCMGAVDPIALRTLIDNCRQITAQVTGQAPREIASSTDCNIPLSLGIPAVCIGVYTGGGMHTREEWVDKASFSKGLEIAVRVLKHI